MQIIFLYKKTPKKIAFCNYIPYHFQFLPLDLVEATSLATGIASDPISDFPGK